MKCPICRSRNKVVALTAINRHGNVVYNRAQKFNYYDCQTCQSWYLGGVKINQQYYQKYYGRKYTAGKENVSWLAKLLTQINIRLRERLILSQVNQSTRINILDVGCGDGLFLINLSQNRFNKFGVEISQEAKQKLALHQIKLYTDDIMKVDFGKQKFKVITLWHVIEHLTDPVKVLAKCRQLLAPDGVIVLATPSTDSWGFKLGRANWFHLDAPRHLVLFNDRSLNQLAKQSNLELVKSENDFYTFPTDLFWSIVNWPYRWLIYLVYPIAKWLDPETKTYLLKK